MSIWDNVKKFAQPYSDDEYDDYDEDEDYSEDYEEEAPRRPQRTVSRRSRQAAPVEEDDEDDYDYHSPVSGSLSSNNYSGISNTGFTGSVLSMNNTERTAPSSAKSEVVLFRPTNFNDTSKAADDLRSRKAVVCNMENVDKAMARRVVDFLSGCVYALDGDVKKIAQSAYLFCPHNMDIVGDLESIQAEVENYI